MCLVEPARQNARLRQIAGLALAAYFLACRPGHAQPLSLTPAQQQQVERGEIVIRFEQGQDDAKTVTSIGRINHPANDVYRLMTDFANFPRIYSGITAARVESQTPTSALAHFSVSAPWPISGRTVTVESTLDPKRHAMAWHRVSGTISRYEGTLAITPDGRDRCTLYYSSKVDPGLAFVPSWLFDWGQEKVLPTIVQAIRDTLGKRQGPYWEPDIRRPTFSKEPAR